MGRADEINRKSEWQLLNLIRFYIEIENESYKDITG